jgi:hypothetical protein
MPHSNALKQPVLTVMIAGQDTEKQPSSFTLITDAGLPSVMAKLTYPRGEVIGAVGDSITISLVAGEERVKYFTGTIYKIYAEGKLQILGLSDGYKTLCNTTITPAYRKETVKAILQDTLNAAGITETAVACPGVELARFSTVSISAARCIDLLIQAIEEHSVHGLRYFFDAEDRFHFGTGADTGRNEGEVIAFESRKDIITAGDGYIEVMPHPIRHSQTIKVDDRAMETVRTELVISRANSRLTLWIKRV